jgi:serine phosphatase RsbU (regulator of sigma subunit)
MFRNLLVAIFVFVVCTATAQQEIPLQPSDTFAIRQYTGQGILASKANDKKEESRFYDQIAFIYWEHNFFDKASEYYQKSLELNKQLNNLSGMSMLNSNLGLLHADLRKYDLSLQYFQQTLAYRKMVKEKVGIISTLINISVVLNNLARFEESAASLNEALTLARELNDIDQMRSCYGMLSETYEKAKQPEKAHYYFEFYRTFQEKSQAEKEKKTKKELADAALKFQLLESEKRNKELQLQLTTTELYGKEKELTVSQTTNKSLYQKYTRAELQKNILLKDNLIKISDLEKQRAIQQKQHQRFIFLWVILGLILLVLFAFVLLYRQKGQTNIILEKKNLFISEQKNEIEIQQKDLTDSINYALNIQQAALKGNANLEGIVDDHFVLYKPVAIVSGDYYWFSFVDHKLVIVAADCTGHGVPGAFMSIIGMNLLNQFVKSEKMFMPDEILMRLNTAIVKTLDQEKSHNRDGMDAAICTVDFDARKLYFAGAMRPMIIVNDGQIQIVKGSNASLGGSQESVERIQSFELQTFDISSPTRFYLFSDGYPDQVNEKMKKLSSKRFYDLIAQMNTMPWKEQRSHLESFFVSWMGNMEQVDDVMVLGFSLK